jgi:enamine deaminase RidA (YjgF/YER057c/UK114 family)
VSYDSAIGSRAEAIGPGRILCIAGQQGRDIDNKIVGASGDFRAQAEQAFLNIKGALGAVGGGFEHVVKLCHYFIDLQAHFRMMRDIRLKYFDQARASLDHDPGRRADRRESALRGRYGGRVAVRFKGKWLRGSSISDAALTVLRIFVVNACGARPAQNGEFVRS